MNFWRCLGWIIFVCSMAGVEQGCIESYRPPAVQTDYRFLVVDGYVNSGSAPTVINLSRTQTLADTHQQDMELNAQVQVEDDQGNTYPLAGDQKGTYSINYQDLNLHPDRNYRVRIKTEDNKEYTSDFVAIQQTPPIDSVSWKLESDGVQVSVNTHDPENNTRYYLWTFDETWKYTAAFNSDFIYNDGQVTSRPTSESIYYCWLTEPSTRIYIGTSAALSQDIISEYGLTFIPYESVKLSYRYSILVSQYALSKEAYEFWLATQKNTENLGTVFGPLPSQTTGNIHCVTNPDEPVLGFIGITSLQQKRMFIDRQQVPSPAHYDNGYQNCGLDGISVQQLLQSGPGGNLLIDALSKGPVVVGYTTASSYCADCRLRGGTTVQPDFW